MGYKTNMQRFWVTRQKKMEPRQKQRKKIGNAFTSPFFMFLTAAATSGPMQSSSSLTCNYGIIKYRSAAESQQTFFMHVP